MISRLVKFGKAGHPAYISMAWSTGHFLAPVSEGLGGFPVVGQVQALAPRRRVKSLCTKKMGWVKRGKPTKPPKKGEISHENEWVYYKKCSTYTLFLRQDTVCLTLWGSNIFTTWQLEIQGASGSASVWWVLSHIDLSNFRTSKRPMFAFHNDHPNFRLWFWPMLHLPSWHRGVWGFGSDSAGGTAVAASGCAAAEGCADDDGWGAAEGAAAGCEAWRQVTQTSQTGLLIGILPDDISSKPTRSS